MILVSPLKGLGYVEAKPFSFNSLPHAHANKFLIIDGAIQILLIVIPSKAQFLFQALPSIALGLLCPILKTLLHYYMHIHIVELIE